MNERHAARLAVHKIAYQAKKRDEQERLETISYIRNHPDEFCAYCYTELDDDNCTGFCSIECEEKYGECPKCGAPSKGNAICWDCREP